MNLDSVSLCLAVHGGHNWFCVSWPRRPVVECILSLTSKRVTTNNRDQRLSVVGVTAHVVSSLLLVASSDSNISNSMNGKFVRAKSYLFSLVNILNI